MENGDKSQFDQLSDFQSNSYVCLSRTFIQNMTSGYALFGLTACIYAHAVLRHLSACAQ